MALKYGFFNSSNGDRKYDAEDISSIFDGVIGDGIFATIGKIFAVTPGEGLQVLVDTGKAWFNHTWTVNGEIVPLNLEEPDITLDRYDAIALEVNHTESVRANSLKVIKGNPSSEPTKPSLIRDDLVNQYPLAYVLVKHGASSLTSAEIEIMVGKGECPFVRGPIETVPIDELFSKWESEFDAWFENVQSQLEGDIAANLQRQIDERVKIADKATEEDSLSGQDDEKWMTPKQTLIALDRVYEIGDVLTTARNIDSDKWLVCDGEPVSKELYPELNNLLGSIGSIVRTADRVSSFPYGQGFPFNSLCTDGSSNTQNPVFGKLFSGNGKIMFIGGCYATRANLFTKNIGDASYSKKSFSFPTIRKATPIRYLNGQYFFIATDYTDTKKLYMYRSLNGSEWFQTYIASANEDLTEPLYCEYVDGQYYLYYIRNVTVPSSLDVQVVYGDDPSFASKSSKTAFNPIDNSAFFICKDGLFCVEGGSNKRILQITKGATTILGTYEDEVGIFDCNPSKSWSSGAIDNNGNIYIAYRTISSDGYSTSGFAFTIFVKNVSGGYSARSYTLFPDDRYNKSRVPVMGYIHGGIILFVPSNLATISYIALSIVGTRGDYSEIEIFNIDKSSSNPDGGIGIIEDENEIAVSIDSRQANSGTSYFVTRTYAVATPPNQSSLYQYIRAKR